MLPIWLKHMNSVLSALTWTPMPPAVRSRLCSKDLAWAGVFAGSAMPSAKSASVIVRAGYLLLLAFAKVTPFSFIKPIDVRSTLSMQIINRYGANVSPCSTPATMSKKSVSPSRELLSCFYIESLWLRQFLWGDVFAPSFLCVWSQMPWISLQIIVSLRFFAWIPSHIWRIVKICDVVEPFWFFLRIFSLSGSMQLSGRALYILAAMDVRVIPRQFLAIPRSLFLGKERCSPLSICLLCSGYVRRCSIEAVWRRISLSSILLGVFHQALQLSYF